MAPSRIPGPSPELIARAKRLYLETETETETETATDDIAKMLGVTPGALRTLIRAACAPDRLCHAGRRAPDSTGNPV